MKSKTNANAARTLVLELTTDLPVGTDACGDGKVRKYLLELAAIVGLKPLMRPRTHVSPKYGLSGWLPLERGAAIHLYAWDDREPSFISVDVAAFHDVDHDRAAAHAREFFGVGYSGEMMRKSSTLSLNHGGTKPAKGVCRHHGCQWRDLDPSIHRQRLSLAGLAGTALDPSGMRGYLETLCRRVDMVRLSDPFVQGHCAWMHWETSGVVVHWNPDSGLFLANIYTCKPFEAADAISFTWEYLGAKDMGHHEF